MQDVEVNAAVDFARPDGSRRRSRSADKICEFPYKYGCPPVGLSHPPAVGGRAGDPEQLFKHVRCEQAPSIVGVVPSMELSASARGDDLDRLAVDEGPDIGDDVGKIDLVVLDADIAEMRR